MTEDISPAGRVPANPVSRNEGPFPRSSLGSGSASTADPRAGNIPALDIREIQQLGPYRLIRELGAGGMGMVFEAQDVMLMRHVALKVLRPGLHSPEEARERFLREARAMAKMSHDNIVTIYQVGEDRGLPFMAMQLLDGESLEERIRREVIRIPEVIRIGREIAEGLHTAHETGLIHQDIKPANIWLEKTRDRVKLLDFGLARYSESGTSLPTPGVILGTPGYMSPEQARGETLDPRSDLFSLGCVLYEILTGDRPFRGSTVEAMLMELETFHPTRVHGRRQEVSSLLSNLVMELLSKNRKDRPATAAVVIERLNRVAAMTAPQLAPAIVPPAMLAPIVSIPVANAVEGTAPTNPEKTRSGMVPAVRSESQETLSLVAGTPTQFAPSGSLAAIHNESTPETSPAQKPLNVSSSIPVVVAPSASGSFRSLPIATVQSPVIPPGSPSQSTRSVGATSTRLSAIAATSTLQHHPRTSPNHTFGGFLQFGILALILGTLVWTYYHFTNKGTVGLDCDDPTVVVEIRQNGELIQRLNPQQRVSLHAGDYDVSIAQQHQGEKLTVSPSKLTIRRKETEIIRVYPNALFPDSGSKKP